MKEGRWLTGDASARASEETGVQSDLIRTLQAIFQLNQKLFLGLEDCMLSFWSLFHRSLMYSSPVEELVLLNEDHKRDINSTGARLSLRQMWLRGHVSKFQKNGVLQRSQEGRKP